jgi:hypothetical protein
MRSTPVISCAPERVDDAGVAARADHYEPAIAEPKAGRVLVPFLIGHRFAGSSSEVE